MKVTYLGYACVNIDIDGTFFLVDLFINPDPLAKHIDTNSIKADYVLITYAHADHIVDMEVIAKHTGAQLITNPEILVHFEAFGLSGYSMNLGDFHRFVDGKVKIKMIRAERSSSFPGGSYGGNPTGFLIDHNDEIIYIAGGTALYYNMKTIPHQYRVDLGIFPTDNNYTIGARDALTAARFVQVDSVLGVYYDTFPVIKINKELSKQKLKDDHRRLHLIETRATLNLKDLNIYTL